MKQKPTIGQGRLTHLVCLIVYLQESKRGKCWGESVSEECKCFKKGNQSHGGDQIFKTIYNDGDDFVFNSLCWQRTRTFGILSAEANLTVKPAMDEFANE